MSRSPTRVFAAPLVLTCVFAPAALADPAAKIRFDGYQCYSGPPETESSVPCPKKLLPKPKKNAPVIDDGGACFTLGRKQVRCPPNLVLADPSYKQVGDSRIGFDEGTFACQSYADMHCPEGASCNPPPPQAVACPDDLLPHLATHVKPTKRKKGACYLGKVKVVCP